jgi:hypothetical protein
MDSMKNYYNWIRKDTKKQELSFSSFFYLFLSFITRLPQHRRGIGRRRMIESGGNFESNNHITFKISVLYLYVLYLIYKAQNIYLFPIEIQTVRPNLVKFGTGIYFDA